MRNLIIIGAGGFAREVHWLAKDCGTHNVLGFLDDSSPVGTKIGNSIVLGTTDAAESYVDHDFVIAIGNPRVRRKLIDKLKSKGINTFATLIHPSVKMSNSVKIGSGSMICAGVILTVDITIGEHVIININSTVGHDCKISDFCTIAPIAAISGNVTMGNCVEVGTGASIRQGTELSDGAMLGMGACLTKSIPANQIFIGNPASYFKSF